MCFYIMFKATQLKYYDKVHPVRGINWSNNICLNSNPVCLQTSMEKYTAIFNRGLKAMYIDNVSKRNDRPKLLHVKVDKLFNFVRLTFQTDLTLPPVNFFIVSLLPCHLKQGRLSLKERYKFLIQLPRNRLYRFLIVSPFRVIPCLKCQGRLLKP